MGSGLVNGDARDEVDDLVEAWRRERPDLGLAPMEIWSRVLRLGLHLDAARRAAYAEHSIEPWEFDVLAALRRSGSPYRLTPGQLLRETHVTSGTMTNRVDRLVSRGLVARASHPEDGRVVLVELNPAGRELVDAAITSLLAAEDALLGDLGQGERHALANGLRALLLAQE